MPLKRQLVKRFSSHAHVHFGAHWFAIAPLVLCAACLLGDPDSDRAGQRSGAALIFQLPEVVSIADDDDRQPLLIVVIDGYLDPRRSDLDAAFSLSSGVIHPPLRVRHDPVARTLVVRPLDPLREAIRYRFEVDTSALVAADGRGVVGFEPVEFQLVVDPERAPAPSDGADQLPPPTFSELADRLHAGCGCHVVDASSLPPLDRESLLGRSRQLPARRLVEPHAVARSYLIEKLLPDYPDRFGSEMPPPWHDGDPLDPTLIEDLARWIEAGALE